MTVAVRPCDRELLNACFGAMLDFAVISMTGLLVPLMALDLGADAATIGVLISVSNIGALLLFALTVPMLLWWARSRRLTGRVATL